MAVGNEITWDMFIAHFLEKLFPKDMHSKKEIEFLELKLGNSTVVEYATKFEELVKFCPYYNSETAEGPKCIKFKSGLRPEIKQHIGYQDIHHFFVMVNKCKSYDEDNRARSSHYKSLNEKKEKSHNRGELYSASAKKGKQKVDQKVACGKE